MAVSKNQSASARGGNPSPRVWRRARAGRLMWIVALHAAALLALLFELFRPVGEHIKRVAALDFIGSYMVFGLFAAVLAVGLGLVLRRLVMRGEDYYGEPD